MKPPNPGPVRTHWDPAEAATRRRPRAATAAAVALTAGLVLTTVLPAAGATGAEAAVPTPASPTAPAPAMSSDGSQVDPAAAAEVARERGMPVAQATALLGREKESAERGAALEHALGTRTGGDYLDDQGRLVVATLDARADAAVTLQGARAQRVDDSSARLDAIMRALDAQAARGATGAVQGWYVDVPTNSVVVTVGDGAADARTRAMIKVAMRFGSSVRVERAPASEAPQPAEWMVGGYEYRIANGGTCSVGFDARDSLGRNVVVTAGHCVKAPGTMTRNGYAIGATRTANFPVDDFGTFWNSYPSYWQPSVSVSKYNGTFVNVRGRWDTPPVGATVCKSGRTTGYTCGVITALNQTVSYPTGAVYGLVRHNACVEGGDSGGSNISGGAYALGVTSGASLTTNGQCLSKAGGQNVSWYQPIGEALSSNGLSLVYQP